MLDSSVLSFKDCRSPETNIFSPLFTAKTNSFLNALLAVGIVTNVDKSYC